MFEKVKAHVERNRGKYEIVGIVAIAGITYAIMRSTGVRGAPVGEGLRGGPETKASFIFRNKGTINVTTVLDREGKGHPGWPVQNLETKRLFFSQKEAADAIGVPESLMSGHIHGKFPDIDGLHFKRVNLVPTP